MKIPLNQARELVTKVLEKHQYTPDEIKAIAEVLMYGVMRDSSQGFPKLFGWHVAKSATASEPEITHTTGSVIRVNAQENNGMYACQLALRELMETAKAEAICMAGVYNTYSSSGAIGYYTSQLANSGYVGLMLAASDPIGGIGIKGSKQGIFGTNPLAISIPYKHADITLDMSTAKYTWGDLVKLDTEGKQLESGFAYDANGDPTTSPKAAMSGSVATFDGLYKGLGLAFMIQVLAGGMLGSAYAQSDETCAYGNLLLAINPKYLGGQEFLDEQTANLISVYKQSGKVFLPGEQGTAKAENSMKSQQVEISQGLLDKITKFLAG